MNNVLGAILGLASAQRECADPGSPLHASLCTIISACERGREAVRGLLGFARRDQGATRPTDLNALVRDLVDLLTHATFRKVRLETDLQEGLPALMADATALSHAVMNLCVNAVDAMPSGGTLTLRTCRWEDGGLGLRVLDTGEGMPPQVLAKAVDPFFTTKPQGKGTGLGLAMVDATMKAHDGRLHLSSQAGRGTEITLSFPPSRLCGPASPAPAPSPALTGAGGARRVLLVDDDELIRESVGPMLALMGHSVHCAAGGREALELLDGGLEADLVILDMNMPDLNGAATLPLIRKRRPRIPVLLATGFSDQDLSALMEGLPQVHCIRKPFSLAEIQQTFREILP
jgi:CheY-like chemotaxis protein/anti-sigma regulatory factor (Ser/Thr protein kinase)